MNVASVTAGPEAQSRSMSKGPLALAAPVSAAGGGFEATQAPAPFLSQSPELGAAVARW